MVPKKMDSTNQTRLPAVARAHSSYAGHVNLAVEKP